MAFGTTPGKYFTKKNPQLMSEYLYGMGSNKCYQQRNGLPVYTGTPSQQMNQFCHQKGKNLYPNVPKWNGSLNSLNTLLQCKDNWLCLHRFRYDSVSVTAANPPALLTGGH